MRGSSAEREDSEEENLGGRVNFQQRNPRADYADVDGFVRAGNSGSKNNRSNNRG